MPPCLRAWRTAEAMRRRLLQRLRHLGLRTKVPLTFAVIIYAVALTVLAAALYQQWRHMEDGVQQNAAGFSQSLALLLRPYLLHKDYWGAYSAITKLAGNNHAFEQPLIIVLDGTGRVFASNRPRLYPIATKVDEGHWPARDVHLHEWQALVDASMPIFSNAEEGYAIGRILFRASIAGIFSAQRRLALIVVGIATLIALLGALAGAFISRRMTEPLVMMRRAMPLVMQRRYEDVPKIRVRAMDEIGQLVRGFNQMISELQQQRELERQVKATERLSAMGRLAASAAHEIRNPLGGVLNSLSTLDGHAYDPAVREQCLKTIRAGLHQIRHIVDAMLGYSGLKEGEHTFSRQALTETMLLLKHEARRRGVSLGQRWQAPAVVAMPASPMQQLVINLCMNAIHACNDGGRVEVSVEQDEQGIVLLRVSDNGCGIPQEVQESIFEPFWSSKADGTGLGLWVCCRIAAELDGVIRVESESGRGSIFELLFEHAAEEVSTARRRAVANS